MMYELFENGASIGFTSVKPEKTHYKAITDEEYKQKQELTKEKRELENWFDGYYAQHEQKFRRLHTLNKLTDEGKNAYDALIDLYNEAEKKRQRIQEIEELTT